MKNHHVEHLKQKAKIYHRDTKGRHFSNGIYGGYLVKGSSCAMRNNGFSWMAYFTCILNDYSVAVEWLHPRLAYKRAVHALASQACEHLNMPNESLIGATPRFLNTGKPRQNLEVCKTNLTNELTYFEELQRLNAAIKCDPHNGIKIAPSIDSRWNSQSRRVRLVIPMEVCDASDLHVLANLTKRLLKRETQLGVEFPEYAYRQEDWVREFPQGVENNASNKQN